MLWVVFFWLQLHGACPLMTAQITFLVSHTTARNIVTWKLTDFGIKHNMIWWLHQGPCQFDKRHKCHKCHNTKSCLLSTTNVTAYHYDHQQLTSNHDKCHMVFRHEKDKRQRCHKPKLKQKQVYLHVGRYDFLLLCNINNECIHKNAL